MEVEINQEEVVRDVTSVTSRLQLHQELKAEIDAREDTFSTVAENGQLMIDASHFAASDVCQCSKITYCSPYSDSKGRWALNKTVSYS